MIESDPPFQIVLSIIASCILLILPSLVFIYIIYKSPKLDAIPKLSNNLAWDDTRKDIITKAWITWENVTLLIQEIEEASNKINPELKQTENEN